MAATLDAVRRAGRGEAVWQPAQLARIAQWRAAVQRPWTSLTERERALLLAVSHGESNRDIARWLHITERTVEFHMGNVLGKLALPSRAAAVAWVKERSRTLGRVSAISAKRLVFSTVTSGSLRATVSVPPGRPVRILTREAFMLRSILRSKLAPLFLLLMLMAVLAQPILAWQVGSQYGHNNQFGGEANTGWHRGNVELVSANERWVRAGDDYVVWTQSQLNWWTTNGNSSNRPAMVYHAFKDRYDNGCGDIQIVNSGWSWSNLPGWSAWTKTTCFAGPQNEIRFLVYNYGQLSAGSSYYFQHIFRDQKFYSSGGTTRGKGKVTVDTYHDRDQLGTHVGVTQDYHGVFCVTDTNDSAFVC